jgi:tellurite resistance protein TerC
METTIPAWFEIGSLLILVAILAFDLILAYRRPHVPSTRESALWVSLYIGLALVFALVLFLIGDAEQAGQFIAGWLTEYSLSIDNLFVFVIIFARFAVPRKYQQEVLMVGIIIALVLRAIFILLGAGLIENFSWVFYLFGAFLIYTAVRQWFENHQDMEQEESRVIAFLRRHIAITDVYDGGKLRTVVDGKKVFTPILAVFLALGLTDLLFALDSIPAIFGITTDPFLVFAANIGVKLVFHALHTNQLPFINGGNPVEWAPEISTVTSLAVIVGSMAVAVAASLVKIRVDARRVADKELASTHSSGTQ